MVTFEEVLSGRRSMRRAPLSAVSTCSTVQLTSSCFLHQAGVYAATISHWYFRPYNFSLYACFIQVQNKFCFKN